MSLVSNDKISAELLFSTKVGYYWAEPKPGSRNAYNISLLLKILRREKIVGYYFRSFLPMDVFKTMVIC